MYKTIGLQELHQSVRKHASSPLLFKQQKTIEKYATASSMKPVPLVLLITSVLLSHIPLSSCRPRDLSSLHNQLDDLLLGRPGGGGDAMSVLMGEKLLQYLQRSAQRAGGALHLPQIPAPQQDNSLEELSEFSKRNDDPPISIDLTFHLLRNMIEMARIENQREQAELNRKYLDEVGK